MSFDDTEESTDAYGVPPLTEYGAPSSQYGAPTLSSPPDYIRFEAPTVISPDLDQYGAPEAPILKQEDPESNEPADKVSDLYFSPVESEVFNINDVSKYFPNDEGSVKIIDLSSSYPDSPETIDIQIVKEDNDDISSATASFGNSYTTYTNPTTAYSYNSNPSSSGAGEYSYIPSLPDEFEDSLASPSEDSVVVSVPLEQGFSPGFSPGDDQQTFFDNLRQHTSPFSGQMFAVWYFLNLFLFLDFDPGKTWETFSNWGGKILSSW